MNETDLAKTLRRSISAQHVVEQAEAFLRSHIGDPVPIPRLSRIVGVSERSLRNAFYQVRGMSPKRCVVRERLNQVRLALRQAPADRGAITHIATDFGFFELGRFAGSYRAAFGETPSQTLRSSADHASAA